jgi:TolB-like protein
VAPRGGLADVGSGPYSSQRLPVVAILPFENQTGEAKQDYFADGFTDELIGALGRFNTLRVIARNATRSRKSNSTTNVTALSSDLGATYLVEGGIRKSGERLRVSARLTDALAATVLWSERFDGTMSDIFSLQDDISRRIAGTVAAGIVQLEAEKSSHRPVPQQGAYDLALQARAAGSETSRAENRRIRNLLTKAINIDPGYAGAYSLLAEAIYARVALGWTEFPSRDVQQAEMLARKAIELAPNDPDGHRALGRLHLLLSEYDRAQTALQRAIDINPSDANALAAWGAAKLFSGQANDATKALSLAWKYDPTLGPIYINDLALAYYFAGNAGLALQTAERGISQYSDYARFHIVAAAASAGLGQKERARRHVREVRQRIPFLTLNDVGSRFKNAEQIAQLKKGLSLAGF